MNEDASKGKKERKEGKETIKTNNALNIKSKRSKDRTEIVELNIAADISGIEEPAMILNS